MTAKLNLAPKRPKRYRETPEYAAMLRRLLRGYRRRVAVGDIDQLPEMAAMATEVDNMIHDSVTALIDRGCRHSSRAWSGTRIMLGRPVTSA
jgi:hypothetical protein